MSARLYASDACPRLESRARICASTACACSRFDAMEGSAVAGPAASTRNAPRAASAAMMIGAGRACEERHAPSRSPVDRPADGGVTGHKSGSLAAPHDVCTRQPSRKYLQTASIRVVRSPALCGGVRDTSCRARRSSSSDAPPRRRPAHPVRPTGSRRSRTRSARRSSSSTPPSRPSRGRAASAVAARTPAAGTRCEASRAPGATLPSSALARRDQPAGRRPAAPALRRGRCRPDRRPARRAVAAGDARRARRA